MMIGCVNCVNPVSTLLKSKNIKRVKVKRMETKMINEINEAIARNFPEQVGKVLRERLEYCDSLEKVVAERQGEVERLTERNRQQAKIIENLNTDLAKHIDLEQREIDLEKKENEYEKKVALIRLHESEKRADMVQNFVNSLMRNTDFRRDVYKTCTAHGNPHEPWPQNQDKVVDEKETVIENQN